MYGRRIVIPAAGLVLAAGLAAPAAASPADTGRVVDRPVRTTGCGKRPPAAPGAAVTRTVVSGGLTRTYLLHLPSGYRPGRAMPVVLSFHGRTRTSEYQQELTGMDRLDAIVAYPQGTIGTDGQPSFQGAPYSSGVDDVLFTSDLLNQLQRQLCVDPSRIYVSGKSNGGGFAGVLACRLSGRIAASAQVSGAFYPQGGACTPTRPTPVIEFHGSADTTIPYDGNPAKGLPPIPTWLADWAARNRCTGGPVTSTPVPAVTRSVWRGCAASVVHYRIEGLGHTWPSTTSNPDSATPTVIDATPIIWKFFREHRLRRTAGRAGR
ncbi:alpha/beta hydrolase family esterase [Actinoplanes sp. HUAS TT8]|uniref:alpha/beta hydrolase family esterase n=1 Tax=Actinoplanes sp. HUAS TT8 TaxID=3447453 RepID=UPI003F52038A